MWGSSVQLADSFPCTVLVLYWAVGPAGLTMPYQVVTNSQFPVKQRALGFTAGAEAPEDFLVKPYNL